MSDETPITGADVDKAVASQESDPDQAWKVLSLVNDWVRYTDAKTAVALNIGITWVEPIRHPAAHAAIPAR